MKAKRTTLLLLLASASLAPLKAQQPSASTSSGGSYDNYDDYDEDDILGKYLEEFSVGGTFVNKNEESGMVTETKEAAVMQTGVSNEEIKKTQDKDASEVVKRVSGVSMMDNRFVMVRGLSQRYNNVWIDGSVAPSSEADSRAFSFDVIPSSQMDNMVVVKSPSPEYPADFAGGMILVETKSIPRQNSFDINASVGANTSTTFSEYRYAKGAWTDYLGFDNGLRSLSGGIDAPLNKISGSDEAIDLQGNGLNNDWRVRSLKGVPEMSIGASLNRRFQLNEAGDLIGLAATLNWSNSYKSRVGMVNNLFGVYDAANDRSNYLRQSTDDQYNQYSKLCAMLNLAYRSSDDAHKVEWKTMVNQLGHASYTSREGVSAQSNQERSAEYAYSSRNTTKTQLNGKHEFSGSDLKWNVGYAYSNKNTPDRRRYVVDDALTSGLMQLTTGNEINREFTYLNEHSLSLSADWKKEFEFGSFYPVLKAGIFGEQRHRAYTTRNFIYNWNMADNTLPAGFRTLPIEDLMDESNYGLQGLHLLEEVKMRNNYKGNNTLTAAYAAVSLPFKKVEIYGGVRFERNRTEIINNTRDYELSEKSTAYVSNDFFPSANIKYDINKRHQLRAAYGRSCNRPEFRELSSSVYYDFDLGSDVQGNTELKTCYVQNVELRYAFYPGEEGEQVVFGAFYKHFDNPIEWTYTVAGGTDLVYSYENAASARNLGLELEVRLNLERIGMKNFTWTFNGSLIKSKVFFAEGSVHRDRPMQGQSPYLINTGLHWNYEKWGLQASILYNRIGKRIVGVGRNVGSEDGDVTASIPDSYEMPRNLLDLAVSKRLGDHWDLKLSVRDMLASKVYYNQIDEVTLTDGTTKTVTETTRSFRPGATILIGASYKF